MATDGSKSNSRSGSAVYCKEYQEIHRLPDYSSIFTCELFAIHIAMKYIKDLPNKYVILVDNRGVIEAI